MSLVVKCSACLIFMCLYFDCSSVVFFGESPTHLEPTASINLYSFFAGVFSQLATFGFEDARS